MSRKLKGFSLAELLISLLIISIVLSAAIPTITKKSGAARENIWHWTDQNNSIYAATGLNQTALVGIDRVPTIGSSELQKDYKMPGGDNGISPVKDYNETSLSDDEFATYWPLSDNLVHNYSNEGNKLVLLRKPAISGQSQFVNSHIAFYTAKETSSTSGANFGYAGRISADSNSLAFGIGSLINQDASAGDNTAIGHLAMMDNFKGARNTALGRKALSKNAYGSYNTAIGFGSLFRLGTGSYATTGTEPSPFSRDTTASDDSGNTYSHNTAIGSMALKENKNGKQNTAVGSYALAKIIEGRYNTALGYQACGEYLNDGASPSALTDTEKRTRNYNICIGREAGNELIIKDKYGHLVRDYGFYLGNPGGTTSPSGSIITGSLQRHTDGSDTIDKFLSVNARRFELRPFNASFPIFNFEMLSSDPSSTATDGYQSGTNIASFGFAEFNLRHSEQQSGLTDKNNSSLRLQFMAPYSNNYALIYASNPFLAGPVTTGTTTEVNARDINFNHMLTFDFPGHGGIFHKWASSSDIKVAIRAEVPNWDHSDTNTPKVPYYSFPLILNDIVEINNSRGYQANASGSPVFDTNKRASTITLHQVHTDKPVVINATGSNTEHYYSYSSFKFPITGSNSSDYEIHLIGDNSGSSLYSNAGNFHLTRTGGLVYNSGNQLVNITGKVFLQKPATSSDGLALQVATGDLQIDAGDVKFNTAIFSGKDTVKTAFAEVQTKITQLDNRINTYHSDARLKNISGDNTAGLKEINALEVKNYTFKKDKKKTPHVGVIAQQLQKIFPDAVTKDEDGYLLIRTEDIFYAMVNSIKELCKQLQDLTAKVTGLDKRITELEKQNKQLQEQNKAFEKRIAKLEKEAAKK